MKAKHLPTSGAMLGLMLFFCAALPARSQDPFAGYLGKWCNKDFSTGGNTRITIQLDGTRYSVHMWGRCVPQECDWGETESTQDPKDYSLWTIWKQGFAITTQKLILLADGTLELDGHTHFIDKSGRKDYDSKDVFAKGLEHDWNTAAAPTAPTPPSAPPAPTSPPAPSGPFHPRIPPLHLPTPTPAPPPPVPPQPQQEVTIVDVHGAKDKSGVITFVFKTILPTVAKVQISRHPPVNNVFKTIAASGADAAATKTHTIVLSSGSKTGESFYYVIFADGVRKTGSVNAQQTTM